MTYNKNLTIKEVCHFRVIRCYFFAFTLVQPRNGSLRKSM